MTPTERLLTILRLVREKRDAQRKALKSTEIQESMRGVYNGDAGARRWRRDIRTLRDRGLVDSDLSTPETPNRTGIRLRTPLKPEQLHLTDGEHRRPSVRPPCA